MNLFLENKVCIITGAAQGIGREIARRFADDGAIVYACDRQEFTSDNAHIHPLVFDITDAAAVKTAMMQVFKTEGRIDVLVNNAGVVFNRKIGMIMREETKSAAKELAPQGIRVNAVAPGIVKTERFAELYEANGEKIDERISRIALGRLGTPEDIANACSFLASDRASYISGHILGVDGCASI